MWIDLKPLKIQNPFTQKEVKTCASQFMINCNSLNMEGQWNSGGNCKEVTQPLQTLSSSYSENNRIIEEVIKQMKNSCEILEHGLSEYEIDGHPSIYGRNSRKSGIQDCSHRCLPGIPDACKELLFHHLLQ